MRCRWLLPRCWSDAKFVTLCLSLCERGVKSDIDPALTEHHNVLKILKSPLLMH